MRIRLAFSATSLALVVFACVGADPLVGTDPIDAGAPIPADTGTTVTDAASTVDSGGLPVDAGSDTGSVTDAGCPPTGCEKELVATADTTRGADPDREWAEITYGVAVDDDFVYYSTWPTIPGSGFHPWPAFWGGRVYYRDKKQLAVPPAVLEETAPEDIAKDLARSDGGLPPDGPAYHTASMPSFLARVGDRIMWSTWYSNGGIRSRSVSPSGLGPLVEELSCTDTCSFFRTATDGKNAYVVQFDRAIYALEPGTDAGVRTLTKNEVVDGSFTEPQLRGVFTTNGRVYYSTRTALRSVPIGGGSPTTHFALQPGTPQYDNALFDSITIAKRWLYYADRESFGGMVSRLDLQDPSKGPLKIDTNLGSTQTVLVDGDTLYVVGYDAGVVYAYDLSRAGFPRTSYVTGLKHPRDITVDATHLYIAGGDDAKIYRVPKR